jgi:two-component system, cell cycle sensor histidine kinase and response regulator CckA
MRGSASLYAPVLGLGTLFSLALAAYGWRRRRLVPSGAAFAVFNLGVAIWTGVYIVELNATGSDAVFWANVTYFGIGLVPASWLVFAMRFSGHGERVTARVLALLSVEPLATVLLAWTNPWHRLFRLGVQVTPTWEPGPAFWVHAAYSYGLVLAGTLLIAHRALVGPPLGRGHAGALLVAALAPWTANAIYLGGLSPLGNLDLTPFGFVVTSLAAAWGVFHELEQRLVAAERRFRALIDHTIDAIEVIDPDTGRFLDVNERACAARGYTREEYLTLSVAEIDLRVAERPWQETRDEVRRLGTYVFESEHRRKDGSVFPVEVNATYISLDRGYVLAVVRDISDRKRAEAKFRGLLESAADAMVIADEGGAIVLVNAETERVFGYPRVELLGRPAEVLLPERFRGRYAEERALFMASPHQRHLAAGLDLCGLRKDGTEFPVEVSLSPLQSEEGTLVSAAIRDVTEMKALEEQFREAQKMEAVGRLAGGVAHDFNNILGVVIGYGEIVSRRLVSDDPLRSKMEQILKAAKRAAALTRQLLAFSRQQVLQPRILDLNAVVSEMDDLLRRLIGEDVTLVMTAGPGLGSVEADQGQIQQVIMNLAVNARDAMPDGGQLRIETKNVDVDQEQAARLPLMNPGPYVMLVMTDTGLGMDADTRAHIFDPFFTTKELGKGTGLGLSSVYGIVQQSGGNIYVDSELGVGTSFRIYLPRVASAPLPGADRKRPSMRGSETVLLVEDEAGLRDLLQEALEGSGYRVLVARDGIEALQVVAGYTGPIHLMVTDVIMPGVSGRKAADEIKATRPGMNVLYISGYADDAVLRHGVPGTAAFLEKPFGPDRLLRKVRELLNSA